VNGSVGVCRQVGREGVIEAERMIAALVMEAIAVKQLAKAEGAILALAAFTRPMEVAALLQDGTREAYERICVIGLDEAEDILEATVKAAEIENGALRAVDIAVGDEESLANRESKSRVQMLDDLEAKLLERMVG
jgi:hypothetical protein